jgi:hypothetical protein
VSLGKKEKERERFYLLPGQGGRSLRRKRLVQLRWAMLAAVLAGGVLAGIMWLLSRPRL